MKSGFSGRPSLGLSGWPSSRYRQASNRLGPNPERLIDLRNCFGMMASVSTFARSSGATSPLRTVNFSMGLFLRSGALDRLTALFEVLADALDRVASGQQQRNQRHQQKSFHTDLLQRQLRT